MANLREIQKTIRELGRSPLGIFIRKSLNISPPAIGLKYSEVSSDLFVWRDPQTWQNFFNLSHLGPILNPTYQAPYEALINVFDSDGKLIASKKINLEYGLNNLIDINEIIASAKSNSENGTFAVFHLADTKQVFLGEKICIAERGFVSYKKKSDKSALRSYSHGNMNAIAYSSKSKTNRCIGVAQKNTHYYRPQLLIDDAINTEIAVVNFLNVSTTVKLYIYTGDGVQSFYKSLQIPSGGVRILSPEFSSNVAFIEIESNINFLRPVIFKHYKNHFDVLHG